MWTIPIRPEWIFLVVAILGVAVLYIKNQKVKRVMKAIQQAILDGKITMSEGWEILQTVIELGKDVYQEIQKKQAKKNK